MTPNVTPVRNSLLDLKHSRAVKRELVGGTTYGSYAAIFYILLLFEGVLRKWLVPSAESIFGFIRDPVLLAIYLKYLRDSEWRLKPWCLAFLGWVAIQALPTFGAVLTENASPTILLLGFRGYFLFIPMAIIMWERLDRTDLKRLFTIMLWSAVPVATLVFVQFGSPRDSWINKSSTDNLEDVFTVNQDYVRPSGPFTFVQAQNTFAVLSLVVFIISFELRGVLRLSNKALIGGGCGAAAMGALSGGRTYFGGAILVWLCYLISSFLTNWAAGLRRLGYSILVAACFTVVFVFVFPESFAAMSERQEVATQQEGSTFSRAFGMFTCISTPLEQAPMWGVGIGSASGAAQAMLGRGSDYLYGEESWERNVWELGPVFGLAFLCARIVATWGLWTVSKRSVVYAENVSPLVMLGFSGYLVLAAQTTSQNQLLSFCWFSVGLLLALSHLRVSNKDLAVVNKLAVRANQ